MNKKFIEDNYSLIKSISNYEAPELSLEDREDLVSNIVLRILEAPTEAKQEQASAYIHEVMSNFIKNEKRKNSTDAMGHVTESLDQPVNGGDEERDMTLHDVIAGTLEEDVDDEPDEKEHYSQIYRNDIEELCNYLTKRQAELFRMRYYLGMTPEEMAKELGMENNTIRTGLKRAVKNAFKLTNTTKEDRHRYNGLTIQEMALASIQEDKDLFPFLMYYRGERSLIQIARLTGRNITSIKRSIKAGERCLYNEYSFNIKRGRG